jgi:hypothetical protein
MLQLISASLALKGDQVGPDGYFCAIRDDVGG